MDLWVTPAQGVALNNSLGAITSSGTLADSVAAAAKRIDDKAIVIRVTARQVSVNDLAAVFYSTDRQSGSSVQVSSALKEMIGSQTDHVLVNGIPAIVSGVDQELPSLSLSGAFSFWNKILEPSDQAGMLFISTIRPRLLGTSLSELTGFRLEDTPNRIGHPSVSGSPTILLLSASLSRFDPFSFETKFSSLSVSSTMSSILGWTSKIIFLIGLLLSVTSSLIGIRERRSEIEVFIVWGMRTEFTLLLLAESVVSVSVAFVSGTLLAIVSLAWLLPHKAWLQVLGASVGMGCLYTFILVLVAPLIAAHQVATTSSSILLRSADPK
jgi:hypothetical protein